MVACSASSCFTVPSRRSASALKFPTLGAMNRTLRRRAWESRIAEGETLQLIIARTHRSRPQRNRGANAATALRSRIRASACR